MNKIIVDNHIHTKALLPKLVFLMCHPYHHSKMSNNHNSMAYTIILETKKKMRLNRFEMILRTKYKTLEYASAIHLTNVPPNTKYTLTLI